MSACIPITIDFPAPTSFVVETPQCSSAADALYNGVFFYDGLLRHNGVALA